jgi:hypothetical protein
MDVRPDDGAEDEGLHEVHRRSLSPVQPKPLNQEKQKEEDRDWHQNPRDLDHIPPPLLAFFRLVIHSADP